MQPYAAASVVPLIKSPSLRVPKLVEMPVDIHPLPNDISAYFVYPFTLEPHVITLETARRATLAAHAARREAYLKARDEEKERREKQKLKLVAPGFEPEAGVLVPTKVSGSSDSQKAVEDAAGTRKNVMEDLVEHLARMENIGGGAGAQ